MSGTSFVVYNQNDLHKDYPMTRRASFKDDFGYDQIGTKETIEAVMNLAREWINHPLNKNPTRLLQIGDISRPGGVNTPDHHGHDAGKIVDIRPIRKDSQTGNAAKLNYKMTAVYDQELTKEFIRMVRRLHPNILIRFNDGDIAGKGEFSYVKKDSNNGNTHNDHLHLEF